MNNLCENGLDKSDWNINILICLKTNEPCGFIRYCQTDNCIKMTSNYRLCNYRNKAGVIMSKENKDETIKEIDDLENKKNKSNIINKEQCKVLFKNNKKILIDFKGYGVTIHSELIKDINKIDNIVLIEYEGEIGKVNFKVNKCYI